MRKGAQELKDLDVERVDAVDKPATGRSFLLFKNADGDAVMKGYGALATVTDALLKAARVDKHMVVSRKSATAFNGVAQVLGQDPVFVGKSVPTQPYEFDEPDVNSRGPADEDLGANFSPRSMPGSMVGSVAFRVKDEPEVETETKAEAVDEVKNARKAKAKRMALKAAEVAKADAQDDGDDDDEADHKAKIAYRAAFKAMYDEDEEEEGHKGKTRARKNDGDMDQDDDKMDASERANRGVARRLGKMEDSIAMLAETVNKAITGEVKKIRKSEGAPRSRQIDDDEPVSVAKSGDFQRRLGVSFSDIAFGR